MKLVGVMPYYKPAYSLGGPVASNSDLLEGLVRLGISVTVLTTNANGEGELDVPIGDTVDINGVQVRYFRRADGAPRSFYYAPELGKACRQVFQEADCGYFSATWTYPMFAGARAAWRNKIPYVVCPRGSFMRWSMRQKRLKKAAYMYLVERKLTDRAAAIQCTSILEQQQTTELGLRPCIVSIPNGMDVERFARLPERGRLRARLRLSGTDILSVFVGRLHPMKRIDLAIRAFARVAEKCREAYFAIVGADDGEETRLKDLVANLRLGSRVFFLGLLTGDDLLQLYSDADLLTLLSSRENFGMAVLEAMASGLPVLVGTEVGLADEVQAAGAGWVVGDRVHEIAEAWAEFIMDHARRSRCGEQGRLLVARSFSTEAVARRMLAVLEPIVAQSRRGSIAQPASMS